MFLYAKNVGKRAINLHITLPRSHIIIKTVAIEEIVGFDVKKELYGELKSALSLYGLKISPTIDALSSKQKKADNGATTE